MRVDVKYADGGAEGVVVAPSAQRAYERTHKEPFSKPFAEGLLTPLYEIVHIAKGGKPDELDAWLDTTVSMVVVPDGGDEESYFRRVCRDLDPDVIDLIANEIHVLAEEKRAGRTQAEESEETPTGGETTATPVDSPEQQSGQGNLSTD